MKLDRASVNLLYNNLVDNAVKYSEEIPNIDIELDASDKEAILIFKDQGVGISNTDKKRVLDKFYRVGSEETRKTKGTGLGLFIVDQIVKAHHGEVQILDNKPKGTIFRIELVISD